MGKGRRFTFKGIIVALIVVVMATGIALSTDRGRLAAQRSYFVLDKAWAKHWPFAFGLFLPGRLSPALYTVGILKPVRFETGPGAVFILDPRDMVERTILESGEWQPEIWNSIGSALPKGGVLLDVGAHIGYFSILGAVKVGEKGRVVSFEPNPETLKSLHANVDASNARNVAIQEIACTDREQTLTLYASSALNTGSSSLSQQNATVAHSAPKAFTVRGRPIDAVVRELGLERVDAMKVDVEGAEFMVLQGAMETLKRFHPKIIIEVDPRLLAEMKTTPEAVFALIQSAGYKRNQKISTGYDWEFTVQ